MDIKEFYTKAKNPFPNYQDIFDQVSRIPRSMYYAHCISLYGTNQEAMHLDLIRKLGFYPVNPSDELFREYVEDARELGHSGSDIMEFFVQVVYRCKFFAFAALPGGAIPAGVRKEIKAATDYQIPIIEIPNYSLRRLMSINETKVYLRECGHR